MERDETVLNEERERLREEKGRSWRGTSPGRGEQMTVKRFKRFIHVLCAGMFEWCDTIQRLD